MSTSDVAITISIMVLLNIIGLYGAKGVEKSYFAIKKTLG